MLLQTNSYIVPKERRAEHARLIRRFRQALARIGCDQFEVYEQVGANWSPGGANGRYVQIMRFRDRQHQQAVQAAERNDHGAQAIISEFCDLINFPYQQQHGYFATGFYTSVLPTGPRTSVEFDEQEPGESHGVSDAEGPEVNPFADGGPPSHLRTPDIYSPEEPELAVEDMPAQEPAAADPANAQPAEVALFEPSISEPEPEKGLGPAEAAALADESAVVAPSEEPSLDSYPDPLVDADPGFPEAPAVPPSIPHTSAEDDVSVESFISADSAAAEPLVETRSTADASEDLSLLETPPPLPFAAPADSAPQELTPVFESEPTPVAAASEPEPTLASHPPEPANGEAQPPVDELDLIDPGLLFDDEEPEGSSLMPIPTSDHPLPLDDPHLHAITDQQSAPREASVHHESNEEMLPPIADAYGSHRRSAAPDLSQADEGSLDTLLDDANLLDNVPFPGALEEAPRLLPRRQPPRGNGHEAAAGKDGDLLEFEALIRHLEEDPSAEHGRRAQ